MNKIKRHLFKKQVLHNMQSMRYLTLRLERKPSGVELRKWIEFEESVRYYIPNIEYDWVWDLSVGQVFIYCAFCNEIKLRSQSYKKDRKFYCGAWCEHEYRKAKEW